MRIGIDAHMVGTKETGNETYICSLVNALAKIDKENKYVIFVSDRNIAKNWRLKNVNFIFDLVSPLNLLRLGFQFAIKVRKHQLDIMHFTYHLPLFCSCKTVVSIHDICFKRYPQFFSVRNKYLLPILGKWSAHKANAVITLSNSSKKDIEKFYGINSDKILVISLAANENFFRVDRNALSSVREKYQIDGGFILAIGNIEPKKNLVSLIRAFSRVVAQGSLHHKLIIVGKAQFQKWNVLQEVVNLGIADRVVFTGYVEDKDLHGLYAAADLFVYPSIYEGFGLPVLEAMACGTPVITSNTSSLPEVVDNAAILVDPYDIEGLEKAIYNVLKNPSLQEKMRVKGFNRARSFRWINTASMTLGVYKEVC